jgi:RNA polymerase sigma-54 factor
VNRVLGAIRQAGPPATGARDVRESLLLQLTALNSADPRCALAQAVVGRYLEPLARGRLDAVAAGLGCSPDEIAAAVLYIRRHCTPSPAPGLRDLPAAARMPAVPDVVITCHGELRVVLMEPARLALRIHPGYARLAARGDEHGAREHAGSLVRQAASFISRLDERFATIRQVVEHAAGRQRAFVLRGPRYLTPLAQADVARELGIHESTVSRAVAGKYMMLPSRAVVPVQDFFRPALAPQDALRQLIATEKRPLTDTELAQLLQAQGFRVARRTVAKYRHALGLAAAPLRGPRWQPPRS